MLELALPVHNEAGTLEFSLRRLHAYLCEHFPFSWRIAIVDNASTDDTLAIGGRLAGELSDIRVLHLDRKGRGAALRAAWLTSDATVVAYTDIDLSTGLDALLLLVAPLVSGHSDVAIGSRLLSAANVATRTEAGDDLPRVQLILRLLFSTRVHDAQCGFKAVRSDIARQLVPAIVDNDWFFDTELLLLAEYNGLRIHEVPVDWIDDPDSRVDVPHGVRGTSRAYCDLSGDSRRARTLELGSERRAPLADDMGRRLITFALVGVVSTTISLALFLTLPPVGFRRRSRAGPRSDRGGQLMGSSSLDPRTAGSRRARPSRDRFGRHRAVRDRRVGAGARRSVPSGAAWSSNSRRSPSFGRPRRSSDCGTSRNTRYDDDGFHDVSPAAQQARLVLASSRAWVWDRFQSRAVAQYQTAWR